MGRGYQSVSDIYDPWLPVGQIASLIAVKIVALSQTPVKYR